MFWNRNSTRIAATGLGLAIATYSSIARSQSPAATNQPQPTTPANAVNNNTLALPVIAEPQRVHVGDTRLMTANLFGQERDTFDQVREAQQAGGPTVPPVPGTPSPAPAVAPAPNHADADLLRQAGIVLGSPNTGRLIVERVMPNSSGYAAGVRPGDIIARIDRTPLALSNPLRPAVVTGGTTVGLDIERHGQFGRLVLNMTQPVTTGPATAIVQTVPAVQTAPAPVIQSAPAPVVQTNATPIARTAAPPILRSAVAPVTTPSGRVVEAVPVAQGAPAPLDHATTARSKVMAPGSGSTTGPGVSGIGDDPQGPGSPGFGTAPNEGGGSAAMRTGRNAPVKPGQGTGTGRLY